VRRCKKRQTETKKILKAIEEGLAIPYDRDKINFIRIGL
jgi:hypothetical protein